MSNRSRVCCTIHVHQKKFLSSFLIHDKKNLSPQASKVLYSNGSWASSRRKRNSESRCWAKCWKSPTSNRQPWVLESKNSWRRRTRRFRTWDMNWLECQKRTTTCSRCSRRRWSSMGFRLRSWDRLCLWISREKCRRRRRLVSNVKCTKLVLCENLRK